jgi:hypothetical protein
MKVKVDPSSLRSRFGVVKLVKPVMQEYAVRFLDGRIMISSSDRRKVVVSYVEAPGLEAVEGEFFLPMDRSSLFETNLDKCEFQITDKAAKIMFHSESTVKNASLKKRAVDPKKAKSSVPVLPSPWKIDSNSLNIILDSIACSAQVKETKSDEDMRINQVHFFGSKGLGFSNARFFATVVASNLITNDLSVVSSDIPVIQGFCQKNRGILHFGEDNSKYSLFCPENDSYISFNKMNGVRPSADIPSTFAGSGSLNIKTETLKDLIRWSHLSIEGSQRITVVVSDNKLVVKSGQNDLGSVICEVTGEEYKADFPLTVFGSVVENLPEGDITVQWGDPAMSGVLCISQTFPNVVSNHFIKSMKGR